MGFDAILAYLVLAVPAAKFLLMILGSLVVVGQAAVVLTPSKADDQRLDALLATPIAGGILKALMSFAVIQKKEAPKAE